MPEKEAKDAAMRLLKSMTWKHGHYEGGKCSANDHDLILAWVNEGKLALALEKAEAEDAT